MDKTTNAIAVFNKCAKAYQDRFMEMDLYHDTFDLFCGSIEKQGASVLELACGPGNITRYLLNRRPDLKILGTDLAENMIALAQANNPEAEFRIMDMRAIRQLTATYDAIMCGFGLPYLSKEDAINLIRDAYSRLAEGGVLYLSTMEDDYSKSGMQTGSSGDSLFIHFHQEDYLIAALRENGFTIISILRKDFPTNNDTKVTDLVIIAMKP